MKTTRGIHHIHTNIVPDPVEASLSQKQRIYVFSGLGFLLIIIGFILTPSFEAIIRGFKGLILSYNLLDMNSFMVVDGALGVPFINSGILVLCAVLSFVFTKAEIRGAEIAAVLMTMGFAFCGKTIFNVWPIVLGTLLHSLVHHKALSKGICTAWFACSLSPMINLTAFHNLLNPAPPSPGNPSWSALSIALAMLLGIIAGYIVGFFSTMLPKKHDSYTLYNVGFAAGLSSFLIYAYLNASGLHVVAPSHEYPDIANGVLILCAVFILLYIGICGFLMCKKDYSMLRKIFLYGAEHEDHTTRLFFASSLIHMSVMGFLCLTYALLMTSNMSGAHYAAFFTIVGFAANGITLVTAMPLVLGVLTTSFFTAGLKGVFAGKNFFVEGFDYASSKNMVVTALYSCGLSPFVKRHGFLPGFVMASIHSVLVPVLGPIQGWLNLYSNGFSTGLVSTFYAALVERFVRVRPGFFK